MQKSLNRPITKNYDAHTHGSSHVWNKFQSQRSEEISKQHPFALAFFSCAFEWPRVCARSCTLSRKTWCLESCIYFAHISRSISHNMNDAAFPTGANRLWPGSSRWPLIRANVNTRNYVSLMGRIEHEKCSKPAHLDGGYKMKISSNVLSLDKKTKTENIASRTENKQKKQVIPYAIDNGEFWSYCLFIFPARRFSEVELSIRDVIWTYVEEGFRLKRNIWKRTK